MISLSRGKLPGIALTFRLQLSSAFPLFTRHLHTLSHELQEARETYRSEGFVCFRSALPSHFLESLREAFSFFVKESKRHQRHTAAFDIADTHTQSNPQVKKIKRPHLWHPVFANITRHPSVVSLVSRLLQRDVEGAPHHSPPGAIRVGVRFQGDKLNSKPPLQPSSAIAFHQDWAFYPHTNDDLCTVSIPLEDLDEENGTLLYVPSSHRGPLFSHHDKNTGNFAGGITDSDFDPKSVPLKALVCPAGSIAVHHVRTVHGSLPNLSTRPRPLLLLQYALGDAWPLQQHPRGAWGIEAGPERQIDEWTISQAYTVTEGTEPVRRPFLSSVPVSLPMPWPGRGELNSLYATQSVLDSSAVDLKRLPQGVGVVKCVDGRGDRDVDRRGPAMGSQFRFLFEKARMAARDGDVGECLGWQRLLQFVGGGPYGQIFQCVSLREKLQKRLVELCLSDEKGRSVDSGEGGHGDERIFEGLRSLFQKEILPTEEFRLAFENFKDRRAEARASEFMQVMKDHLPHSERATGMSDKDREEGKNIKKFRLLDWGCGDGSVASSLGRALGDQWEVSGCDVRAEGGGSQPKNFPSNVQFDRVPPTSAEDWMCVPGLVAGGQPSASSSSSIRSSMSNGSGETSASMTESQMMPKLGEYRLPYADRSIDVMTFCMSLHHAHWRQEVFNEFWRVLKRPGGLLCLREHDVSDEETKAVLDLVHGLHLRVWASDEKALPSFCEEFRSFYTSEPVWHAALTAAGFKRLVLRPANDERVPLNTAPSAESAVTGFTQSPPDSTAAAGGEAQRSNSAGSIGGSEKLVEDLDRLEVGIFSEQEAFFQNPKKVFYALYTT
uniref:Methyltransferase type 11 domain-containing protein n=1 Tax=Chromera velia CCMP2878 TaxID=1169474 RepID=A0A0G4FAX2_9ALVE|eukprot:Cvel_16075.t1-p1 / transcript=Cvel_16075.t1 / gene=Cvel_16075 / organism=Chromera_velia_CCMP2878 / gene_product=Probable alpha-ketoglutarate-dependent, putative / transcript_product=Probable alpha-ketoglutarate-dependent, putative / location=Cvel_scaffold1222:4845-8164(+) / protein_length=834 / sequence_SO=supercontig / SO=protein_coding / is_pseudo=false